VERCGGTRRRRHRGIGSKPFGFITILALDSNPGSWIWIQDPGLESRAQKGFEFLAIWKPPGSRMRRDEVRRYPAPPASRDRLKTLWIHCYSGPGFESRILDLNPGSWIRIQSSKGFEFLAIWEPPGSRMRRDEVRRYPAPPASRDRLKTHWIHCYSGPGLKSRILDWKGLVGLASPTSPTSRTGRTGGTQKALNSLLFGSLPGVACAATRCGGTRRRRHPGIGSKPFQSIAILALDSNPGFWI